jgi:hypothetical protein
MSVLTRRTRPPALQWLASVAQGWAEQPGVWRRLVRPDATGRWVEPLAVNERSEVWLQGWPAGERVELHDHGGVSGALCVVAGQLVETWATDLYATRLRQRRLDVGAVSAFGPEYIHDVVNDRRTQALSIQVYAPRLVSMTFYAFHRGRRRGLEPVRTELSEHPVVAPGLLVRR